MMALLADALPMRLDSRLVVPAILFLSYSTDTAVLSHRWTFTDTLKQAWWRLVSFVVPLLMVAVGVEALLQGIVAGIIWFILAGIFATIGRILFHRADGIRMHETKSGELRNRAFAMARKMGVALRRVYSVPAGKGHLTNAYGSWKAIGLTDNLGKYLTKREVDSVIAHELAHVRRKHGRKQLLLSIATFALLNLLLFRLSHLSLRSKLMLDIGVIFVPLLICYFASRRFEYAADREAADYIGDPETVIRALANVYRVSATPPHWNKFTELFTSHPAFTRRAQAIAKRTRLDEGRVSEILLEVNSRKPKSR
jgi:hypothetical protein